jgi:hypothetical protein
MRTRSRYIGRRDNSLEFEEFNTVSEDKDAGSLNSTSVEAMLKRSIRPSTEAKYARLWDTWVAFAIYHEVETMPPEMRALEIFIVDTDDLAGSAGVANSTAAAMAHFCALEDYPTPFTKKIRPIRLTHSKQVRPKKPFMREHVHEGRSGGLASGLARGASLGAVLSAAIPGSQMFRPRRVQRGAAPRLLFIPGPVVQEHPGGVQL